METNNKNNIEQDHRCRIQKAAYTTLLPNPRATCSITDEYAFTIKLIKRKYLYLLLINGDTTKKTIVKRISAKTLIEHTSDNTSLVPSESPLFSRRKRKSACSSCNVTNGRSKDVYVIIRSTAPYSSVESIPVYIGKSKKLTTCVQILPTDIIAVFFASSFPVLDLSDIIFLRLIFKPSLIFELSPSFY